MCGNDHTAAGEVSSGFKARLEYVLDQICINLPDGGSHELRSFIAESLMAAAQAGERSLEGLAAAAEQSLVSYSEDARQSPPEGRRADV
jgi:hypothetical protein